MTQWDRAWLPPETFLVTSFHLTFKHLVTCTRVLRWCPQSSLLPLFLCFHRDHKVLRYRITSDVPPKPGTTSSFPIVKFPDERENKNEKTTETESTSNPRTRQEARTYVSYFGVRYFRYLSDLFVTERCAQALLTWIRQETVVLCAGRRGARAPVERGSPGAGTTHAPSAAAWRGSAGQNYILRQ